LAAESSGWRRANTKPLGNGAVDQASNNGASSTDFYSSHKRNWSKLREQLAKDLISKTATDQGYVTQVNFYLTG
jgi:hypothetical protein